MDLKKNLSNLQERMNNAQMIGDIRQMRQLQLEANQILKSMFSKQFLPLCTRCILFFGVWIILDLFVFFNYRTGLLLFPIPFLGDGWVALYFLFSIGFSLLIYGSKRLYRKLSGKEDKKTSLFRDLMSDLSSNSSSSISGGMPLALDTSYNSYSVQKDDYDPNEEDIGTSDGWKDKIKK